MFEESLLATDSHSCPGDSSGSESGGSSSMSLLFCLAEWYSSKASTLTGKSVRLRSGCQSRRYGRYE